LIEEAKVKGFGISKRMTLTFIYNKYEDGARNLSKKDKSISLEFWYCLKDGVG
jgi:hypothetical protein